MDAYLESLVLRAATIDELLSDDFEALPGQKGDSDLAGRRLAAWCRSSASGDWSLFNRRLNRDGLSISDVLSKFATVSRRTFARFPLWLGDASWILTALETPSCNDGLDSTPNGAAGQIEPCAFEHLFAPIVEQADRKLWAGVDECAAANLTASARANLRGSLLRKLCGLGAPALYQRFQESRRPSTPTNNGQQRQDGASQYRCFIAAMKVGGFRALFDEKPVLLRLIATMVRQWIDTSREFVLRLDADFVAIGREILPSTFLGRVATIQDDLSDPHNGGRSVLVAGFQGGGRVVYKPKDLHLDLAWYALLERLNRAGAPIDLQAMRVVVRTGYGWTEFIDHTGCTDLEACRGFFRRIGAWLALFHCFAASDMHHQNLIAAGEHPVPIDLEMLLQAGATEYRTGDTEAQAFEAAMDKVHDSVIQVGLLPSYARSSENKIFALGGMISDWTPRAGIVWDNVNSDIMRPRKTTKAVESTPNLPHANGRYVKLGAHLNDVISGFEDYGKFLLSQSQRPSEGALFDDFVGLSVRKVVRPTRFYYMLLRRLGNYRTMDDGVIWSAQADFLARLADWDKESDWMWPLQRAERSALIDLNVPHFVSPSDSNEIRDALGTTVRSGALPGLQRARGRLRAWNEQNIAWQIEVIRQNTTIVSRSGGPAPITAEPTRIFLANTESRLTGNIFRNEADRVAAEVGRHAIRKIHSAAWIGLDWLGDSEIGQLAPLGLDLYNGACGIALFLAAHAHVTGSKSSEELARAALSYLRKKLRSRNAARMARSLGVGGATGLGSIVYSLTVMAKLLEDDELLADAHAAAALFTNDLIAADKKLDVFGGSAGGILGLLRLFRDSPASDVLERATKCGEHLVAQGRLGPEGRRTWRGQGFGQRALNGMSHGASGFAYALASLAAITGRTEFANGAFECIVFENSSFDSTHNNWPDFRGDGEATWPCQWCHGAPGIGLARIAIARQDALDRTPILADVRKALAGAEHGWPGRMDTLCCGTLGSIEFFCEAGVALGRDDLRELASRRLMAVIQNAAVSGDYRWNAGSRQFNMGLFRGLAGVGYSCLRRVHGALPNILIWE